MSSNKIPKEPGFHWAQWRIAEDGTDPDQAELLPSTEWTVVEVFMNTLDKNNPDHLMAWVVGVAKAQAIENFFWGFGPLKPIDNKSRNDW